jgi:hypothetical protein
MTGSKSKETSILHVSECGEGMAARLGADSRVATPLSRAPLWT